MIENTKTPEEHKNENPHGNSKKDSKESLKQKSSKVGILHPHRTVPHGRRALHFGKSIHIHYTEFPRMLAERMNHRRGASDEDKQLAGREAV